MVLRVLTLLMVSTMLIGCGSDGQGSDRDPSEQDSRAAAADSDLGGRLLFSRFDESTHTFISTHVSRPDGSEEVEVPMPGPEGGGRWSRSGAHIAVMTVLPDDRIGTAIITPEGDVERVLEIPDPTLNLVCTVWSPDDKRLACEGWDDKDPARAGMYTVRASDGAALVRLTEPPGGFGDLPGDYSPDGESLVFKRGQGEEGGTLMQVPIRGGKVKTLYDEPVDDAGRFSPDGSTILTSDGVKLLLIDLEDGTLQGEVSRTGYNLFGAVWSPDGSAIAYSAGQGGPFADVFTSRPDGSEAHQVTSTPDNEIRIEWGAD